MNRSALLAALIALAAVLGCTKETSGEVTPIRIRPLEDAATKASIVTASNLLSLDVVCYVSGTGVEYFRDRLISDGAGHWGWENNPSGEYFWPAMHDIDLLAYPTCAASSMGDFRYDPLEGRGSFSYDCAAASSEILLANLTGLRAADHVSSPISLPLARALSAIAFRSDHIDEQIIINSVELSPVHRTGVCSFRAVSASAPSLEWEFTDEATPYLADYGIGRTIDALEGNDGLISGVDFQDGEFLDRDQVNLPNTIVLLPGQSVSSLTITVFSGSRSSVSVPVDAQLDFGKEYIYSLTATASAVSVKASGIVAWLPAEDHNATIF